MKKSMIVVAALAVIAATGCKNTPVEERIAKYQEETQALMDEYQQAATEIQADTTLAVDAKFEKLGELEEKTIETLVKKGLKTIKANRDNELAVTVLKDIYYLAELDDVKAAVKMLKEPAASDDFVQKLKENIASKESTAEGSMFTDFEVNGVKFSDFVGKGKYILVDFWASWCGPCKRELPFIRDTYEKFKGDNFDVLSVAVWDKPEDTAVAAKELGVVWNQIVDAQKIPTEIYGIEGIPHIILFGPDGTILKRGLRGDDIAKTVEEYLEVAK